MSGWVIDAERKLEKENPTVQVQLKEGFREEDIKKSIFALVGETPSKVVSMGRGLYRLKFTSMDAVKKMLGLHMRELNGLDKPLVVSMVEQHLSVLEIFEVCHDKLTDRERVDSFQSNNHERRTRHVQAQNPPKKTMQGWGMLVGQERGLACNVHQWHCPAFPRKPPLLCPPLLKI